MAVFRLTSSNLKIKLILINMLFLLLFSSCQQNKATEKLTPSKVMEIPTPKNCKRIPVQEETFAEWLRLLPLKENQEILLFSGGKNINQSFNVLAVLNKPLLFNENIEECVDFALRLWGDFYFEKKKLSQLYLYSYPGEKIYFSNFFPDFAGYSQDKLKYCYLDFLRGGFLSVNPGSVLKGGTKLKMEEARPGDCIIQTKGGSGHTSLILDVCSNKRGEKLFLIGFGYTPAQEFHIEKAPPEYGKEGWFSLDGYLKYLERYYNKWGAPILIKL